jgi:hypothetical protein
MLHKVLFDFPVQPPGLWRAVVIMSASQQQEQESLQQSFQQHQEQQRPNEQQESFNKQPRPGEHQWYEEQLTKCRAELKSVKGQGLLQCLRNFMIQVSAAPQSTYHFERVLVKLLKKQAEDILEAMPESSVNLQYLLAMIQNNELNRRMDHTERTLTYTEPSAYQLLVFAVDREAAREHAMQLRMCKKRSIDDDLVVKMKRLNTGSYKRRMIK